MSYLDPRLQFDRILALFQVQLNLNEIGIDQGTLKLADMFEKATGDFRKLVDDYKMGRQVMPGGAVFRFPIQAEGKHPGFMANYLAIMPEYADSLGVDKNQVYMS